MLLLTMFAAVPLYLTQTIGVGPIIVFHIVMTGILIRVATEGVPSSFLR